MKKLSKLTASLILLFSTQSVFACDYPTRVMVPNGNTATKEDMLNGQKGVKTYVTEMEVYLECIIAEEKSARDALGDLEPGQEQEREGMVNKKYNAAVDEMERLAAQFNAEVQAYNAQDEG
jgi:hypothetical protein